MAPRGNSHSVENPLPLERPLPNLSINLIEPLGRHVCRCKYRVVLVVAVPLLGDQSARLVQIGVETRSRVGRQHGKTAQIQSE